MWGGGYVTIWGSPEPEATGTMDTDTRRQLDVLEEIRWEPSVRATDIGVMVQGPVVILVGRVDSYAERQAAEVAAKRVAGVQAVANDLQVVVPAACRREDPELAVAALTALATSHWIPAERIQVAVTDGWVTLSGEVEWKYQKDEAALTVGRLRGVVGLFNDLAVRPAVEAADLSTQIQAALARRGLSELCRIEVEADGPRVVLRGTVHSLSEREDAERVGWSAPGVVGVENYIDLVPPPGRAAAPEAVDAPPPERGNLS